MSKSEDKRLEALAKKNAAKVKPPRQDQAAQFDPTLKQRPAGGVVGDAAAVQGDEAARVLSPWRPGHACSG